MYHGLVDSLRVPFGLAGPALSGQIYPGGIALDTIDAIYSQYHYNCPPDAAGGGEPCTLFTLTPAPIGPGEKRPRQRRVRLRRRLPRHLGPSSHRVFELLEERPCTCPIRRFAFNNPKCGTHSVRVLDAAAWKIKQIGIAFVGMGRAIITDTKRESQTGARQ